MTSQPSPTKLQRAYALVREAQVEQATDGNYSIFDDVLYAISDLREMVGEK